MQQYNERRNLRNYPIFCITLRLEQNDQYFSHPCSLIQISQVCSKGPIHIKSALIQLMAVCWSGDKPFLKQSWWRHQMESFSALLALCAGNSPVTGEFPSQRPVMWSFDVFFNLHPNKQLSKQSWDWWFETPSLSLWRHCNGWPSVRTSVMHVSLT